MSNTNVASYMGFVCGPRLPPGASGFDGSCRVPNDVCGFSVCPDQGLRSAEARGLMMGGRLGGREGKGDKEIERGTEVGGETGGAGRGACLPNRHGSTNLGPHTSSFGAATPRPTRQAAG